jgi:hypothetical protein
MSLIEFVNNICEEPQKLQGIAIITATNEDAITIKLFHKSRDASPSTTTTKERAIIVKLLHKSKDISSSISHPQMKGSMKKSSHSPEVVQYEQHDP